MSDELSHGRREWVLSALDEFEGPLLRYARRLTGELDLARDVVQHAFLRLCDQEPLELDGRLAAWLYTVCRNRAIDLKRRDGRLEPFPRREGAEGTSRETDPSDWLEIQDAGDVLRGAVATLPEKQQDAVNLWAEGFSYREISRITDDREGYVRVLVHRGIVALREHPSLRRLAEEDDGGKQKTVSNRCGECGEPGERGA
ncbi:MAG TPA: RNA polymerase sigma factor [Pirellulales bacterium]|nr:RNA polymerase sigma factor [Pirellulales bacterium]